MPDSPKSKGIALDLTLNELNPNHKYRMALMSPLSRHWLAELGVVRADESVYLMPLINRPCTFTVGGSSRDRTRQVSPSTGMHVSFHDSGAINVYLGEERVPLRSPTGTRTALGQLFTIVVNSTDSLAEATVDQINNSPARKRVLPLIASWSPEPVGITVYRSDASSNWIAPTLADLVQASVHLPVCGKAVQYHVVVWQRRSLQTPPGEIAILLQVPS